MERPIKILILEDIITDAEILMRVLKNGTKKHEFRIAANKTEYLAALNEFWPDVILSDNLLPQFNATEALAITRQQFPEVPFILVTGTVSEEFAAGIIKQGADDYLLKDRLTRLPAAIESAMNQRRALKEINAYKYALDQVSIVAMTDQNGIIIYANENFCKISQYSPEELLGHDHRILNSRIFPKSSIVNLWTTITNGRIWRGEFCNKAKDESLYCVDATIVPFLNRHGAPYQFLSIQTDITERKEAEKQLITAHERLQFHIDNSPLGFIEWDKDLHVKSWSKRAEEIFGWTEQEFIALQKNGFSQVHPEDLPWVAKIAEQLLNGEVQRNSIQHRIITKSGEVKWCEWYNSVLRDENGEIITIMSLVQDITHRKQAEEELRSSIERFKFVTHAISDIIWELNFENRQYIVHEGKEKLFRDNMALNWQLGIDGEYIIKEDRARVKKSFNNARFDLSCKLWESEYRVSSKENNILSLINHAVFIRDENGKAIRAIGAISDITEKKKLQAELFEQQRTEQLKLTATALEAQEKERNILGEELHDNVNQILVGTKLLLSTIKNDPEKGEEMIEYCIKNLQNAIDENRKITHVLVAPAFKTENLIDQLENLANSMLKTSGIDVNINTSGFEEEKLDNQKKLAVYRIAQEQCTNIVKYANATSVTFTLHTTDSFFTMVIFDNGVGMEKGKKTDGIGLRNIKARLSIFNGTAHINTAPGQGFALEVNISLR